MWSTCLLLLAARQGADDPPADPEHLRAGSFALEGELEVGYRFVDVDGSDAQYEEDWNLDEGPLLRSFRLTGERREGSGTVQGFALDASGVGDPRSWYRGTLNTGDWTGSLTHRRTRFEGSSDTDIHAFDIDRSASSLRLDYEPRPGRTTRAGLELDYLEYERIGPGNRNITFLMNVGGFPTLREGREARLRASQGVELGGFELDLEAGLSRLETESRTSFSEPLPAFPDDPVTEDFDAAAVSVGQFGGVRARRPWNQGRFVLSAGLDWSVENLDGDLAVAETGFSFTPSFPFQEQTTAVSEFELDETEAFLDLAWELGSATDAALRYTHIAETEDGENRRTVILDDLSGTPSISTFRETADLESNVDVVEAELDHDWNAVLATHIAVQYGSEEIEIERAAEVVFRTLDDTLDAWGVRGGIDLALEDHELQLSSGIAWEPTGDPGENIIFLVDDFRKRFLELDWRWRTSSSTALALEGRHEDGDYQAVDSRSRAESCSFEVEHTPAERVRGSLGASYRELEFESDLLALGPNAGPLQTYQAYEYGYRGSLTFDMDPRLHPALAFSYVDVAGDSPLAYTNVELDVPFSLTGVLTIGVELLFSDFSAQDVLDASDYDAWTLTVYARRAF